MPTTTAATTNAASPDTTGAIRRADSGRIEICQTKRERGEATMSTPNLEVAVLPSAPRAEAEMVAFFNCCDNDRLGLTEMNAIMPGDPPVVRYVQGAQAVVDFARQHKGKLILLGINPRDPSLGNQTTSAKNEHVRYLSNFYLDVEMDHPRGLEASDEQVQVVRTFIDDAMLPWLRKHGFVEPVIEFSGNGFHLVFAVEPIVLKDHPEFPYQLRAFYKEIVRELSAELQSRGIRIDSTMEPRRMIKLPGTSKPGGTRRSIWPIEAERHEDEALLDYISGLQPEAEDGAGPYTLGLVAVNLPNRFEELLPSTPGLNRLWTEPATDRSERDWALCRELARLRFTKEEAATTLNHAPYNEGKELSRHYLAFTTGKAFREVPPEEPDVASDTDSSETWLRSGAALFAETLPPPAALIEHIWLADDVGLLVGPPGSLKTWIVLAILIAIITGRRLFGKFEVRNPGAAIYIGEEIKGHYLQMRLKGLLAGMGIPFDELGEKLHFAIREGVKIDAANWQSKIREACGKIRPRIIVFDPLARMINGDESSSKEMRATLDFLRNLEKEFGCAVLVVHHNRKSRDKDSQHRGHPPHGVSPSGNDGMCEMSFFRARLSEPRAGSHSPAARR